MGINNKGGHMSPVEVFLTNFRGSCYKNGDNLKTPSEFLRTYDEWGAELRQWIIGLGYKETLLDYPLHEVHLLYEKS